MSEAAITAVGTGELRLSGVLDYRSGPALRDSGRKLIKESTAPVLVLDCSAVEKSSSVGLSLLLAYLRDARAAGRSLSIRGLPADMQGIAKVSGLLDVLTPHA